MGNLGSIIAIVAALTGAINTGLSKLIYDAIWGAGGIVPRIEALENAAGGGATGPTGSTGFAGFTGQSGPTGYTGPTGGGGGVTTLAELTDVSLNVPAGGNSLVFNTANSMWTNRKLSIPLAEMVAYNVGDPMGISLAPNTWKNVLADIPTVFFINNNASNWSAAVDLSNKGIVWINPSSHLFQITVNLSLDLTSSGVGIPIGYCEVSLFLNDTLIAGTHAFFDLGSPPVGVSFEMTKYVTLNQNDRVTVMMRDVNRSRNFTLFRYHLSIRGENPI